MRKRNEEYIMGETIPLDPFFVAGDKRAFRLYRRISAPTTPNSEISPPDVSGISRWRTVDDGGGDWYDLFLAERYGFDEEDFEKCQT